MRRALTGPVPPLPWAAARTCAGLVLVGVLTAACVGPTTTYPAYRGKALQTARSMVGILASARLTAHTLRAGRTTYAFADQGVSRAERNAVSVRAAFDSRQPPDARSDRLRARLDPLLDDAVTDLTDLRVAVRRADRDGIDRTAGALQAPLRGFQRLVEDLR